MTTPMFDRRVPKEFADALAAGGQMHELVDLVHSDLGSERALDLRLRAAPGRSAARVTLYLGLTRVLHVHHTGAGTFKLEGQAGKGFAANLDPSLFDPSWARPQSLERLGDAWADVMVYVRAAVQAAPDRYVNLEGKLQARLSRGSDEFAAIDREVVIGFPSQADKNQALEDGAAGIRGARELLARTERWAEREKSFGDELDMLAVDRAGRLLVVEVKHGVDTTGVGWTPAQVARYLRLCHLWTDATPWAADILNGMLDQAAHIGLPGPSGFRVAEPVTLVPVIAIGASVKNPPVANARMQVVHDALSANGVDLAALEVWSVDGESVTRVPLGGLSRAGG